MALLEEQVPGFGPCNHTPTVRFSYRTDDAKPSGSSPALENPFNQFEAAEDSLFDSVHQVVMPS